MHSNHVWLLCNDVLRVEIFMQDIKVMGYLNKKILTSIDIILALILSSFRIYWTTWADNRRSRHTNYHRALSRFQGKSGFLNDPLLTA